MLAERTKYLIESILSSNPSYFTLTIYPDNKAYYEGVLKIK